MFLIFFRILSIFNIHTQGEEEGFKETDNNVYPKWCNSWIIQKTNAVLNWIQNPPPTKPMNPKCRNNHDLNQISTGF